MKIEFPPPIFKSRPLKKEVLVWRPGKGLSKEWREEPFQFPPPLLTIEFNIEKKNDEKPQMP